MVVRTNTYPNPQNESPLLCRIGSDVMSIVMRFLSTFDLLSLQHCCRLLSDREGTEEISETKRNQYFGCARAAHLANLRFPTRLVSECALPIPIPEKWAHFQDQITSACFLVIRSLSSALQKLQLLPETLTNEQALVGYHQAALSPSGLTAFKEFIETGDPKNLLACIPDTVSLSDDTQAVSSVDKKTLETHLKRLHTLFKNKDALMTACYNYLDGSTPLEPVKHLFRSLDASQQEGLQKILESLKSIAKISANRLIALPVLRLLRSAEGDLAPFIEGLQRLEMPENDRQFLIRVLPSICTLGINVIHLLLSFFMGSLVVRHDRQRLLQMIQAVLSPQLAQQLLSVLDDNYQTTNSLNTYLKALLMQIANPAPGAPLLPLLHPEQVLIPLIVYLGLLRSFKNSGANLSAEDKAEEPITSEGRTQLLQHTQQLNSFLLALLHGGICNRTMVQNIAASLLQNRAVDVVLDGTGHTSAESSALLRLISLGHPSMRPGEFLRTTLGSQPFDRALLMIEEHLRQNPLSDVGMETLYALWRPIPWQDLAQQLLDQGPHPEIPAFEQLRSLRGILRRLSADEASRLIRVVLSNPNISTSSLQTLSNDVRFCPRPLRQFIDSLLQQRGETCLERVLRQNKLAILVGLAVFSYTVVSYFFNLFCSTLYQGIMQAFFNGEPPA